MTKLRGWRFLPSDFSEQSKVFEVKRFVSSENIVFAAAGGCPKTNLFNRKNNQNSELAAEK
jgi:hypothetical protein